MLTFTKMIIFPSLSKRGLIGPSFTYIPNFRNTRGNKTTEHVFRASPYPFIHSKHDCNFRKVNTILVKFFIRHFVRFSGLQSPTPGLVYATQRDRYSLHTLSGGETPDMLVGVFLARGGGWERRLDGCCPWSPTPGSGLCNTTGPWGAAHHTQAFNPPHVGWYMTREWW